MYIKITKIVFRFFQIHNDDGVWVRLSNECVRQMCTSSGYPEAWCLQYNQHLGKTLLVPVEDPKSVVEESGFRKVSAKKSHSNESPLKERKLSAPPQIVTGPGLYHVVKCGASGHNIRSRPGLSAPPVGMLVSGNRVVIVADVIISKKYFSVPKNLTFIHRKITKKELGSSWTVRARRSSASTQTERLGRWPSAEETWCICSTIPTEVTYM